MRIEVTITRDNGIVDVLQHYGSGYSMGGPGAEIRVQHPEEWELSVVPVNDGEAYLQVIHTLCHVCILSHEVNSNLPFENLVKRMNRHTLEECKE